MAEVLYRKCVPGLNGTGCARNVFTQDSVGRRAIGADELARLVQGRGDEQVRLLRNLGFDPDSHRRLRPRAGRQAPVLHEAEGVGDMCPAGGKLRSQQASNLAREPVVGEQEVVLNVVLGGERGHFGSEGWDLVEEGVFVQVPAGRQVDHSRQRREGLLRRVVGRLEAGEHVGGDPAVAESVADFADVDVEAAVGVLAQRSRGRGVHGNDRDPHRSAV